MKSLFFGVRCQIRDPQSLKAGITNFCNFPSNALILTSYRAPPAENVDHVGMPDGGCSEVKSLETRDRGSGKVMFPGALGMARL